MKIYINGKFCEKQDAKISVFDHGFLYGDGVFEGIRSYSRLVFKLKEHIDRLFESAKSIMLDIPMTREQMTKAVIATLKENNLEILDTLITNNIDLFVNPNRKLQFNNLFNLE